VKWLPTATQNVVEVQETLVRLLRLSAGPAVGVTRHAEPSQRSTSVWLTSRRSLLPTAMQNVREAHETPVKSAVPGSGGVATRLQTAGGFAA
jgi:hypothetical protein